MKYGVRVAEEAQTFLGISLVFLKIPLPLKRRDKHREALKILFLVEEGIGKEAKLGASPTYHSLRKEGHGLGAWTV